MKTVNRVSFSLLHVLNAELQWSVTANGNKTMKVGKVGED